MSMNATLNNFYAEYRSRTHQLRDTRIALRWLLMGIGPVQAAGWARLGYLPGEAAPLIEAGVTLKQRRAEIRAENRAYARQEAARERAAAQRRKRLGGGNGLIRW